MREVAKTVKDAKVNSEMSKTVAESFELFIQKDVEFHKSIDCLTSDLSDNKWLRSRSR